MTLALDTSHPRSGRGRGRCASSFVLKALPSALMLVFANAGWAVDPLPSINVGGAAGLPINGTVTAGNANGGVIGNQLTINQTSQRAVLDWTSFNIDFGKSVVFAQPSTAAVALNRITGSSDASKILGHLEANGTVMLMNNSGIVFGPDSTVKVGSLLATTGMMTPAALEDFMQHGHVRITGATGQIVNEGNILATAGTSGLVALVAPSVINRNVITATGGTITLAGSTAATLSLNGGLYEFAIPGGATGTQVSNAAGGTLNARTLNLGVGDAANLVSGVINLEGIQQASSAIVVNGDTVVLKSALQAPTVSGISNTVNVSGAARIQEAVKIARSGGAVNLAAGNYVQPAKLLIDKSLTLSGAGQGATLIDARGVPGYGIEVTADNVTLKDFTLYGPSANIESAYGIKVSPTGNAASARLHDFSIRDVTIRGSGKAELDLNGVVGALIDGVTADGAPAGGGADTRGAGIQITDSANVTVRNSTTRNNLWGGLALYQANIYRNQQVNNITVEASNSFTERNPVYLQDLSTSRDFGTLSIAGFDHAVRNGSSTNNNHQYTWLQASRQNAFDFAVNLGASASSYVQGWTGAAATQNFHVGTGSLLAGGTQAMSIGSAVAAASTGAAVDVYAGTYAEQVVLNKANMTLKGVNGANISVQEGLTGVNITANGVTVEGMQITGPYSQNFTTVNWNAVPTTTAGISVKENVSGARIHNNSIKNVRTGVQVLDHAAVEITGNTFDNTKGSILVRSDNVTMSGNTRGPSGNEWDIVFLNHVGSGAYFTSPHVSQTDYGSGMMAMSRANGDMHILDRRYGSNGLLGSTPQFGNRSHIVVSAGSNFTAVDDFNLGNGLGNTRQPLGLIGDGINAVVSGGVVEVKAGAYAENVNINKALTLDGAGMDQTILKTPTASGSAVTITGASNVTISDLAIADSDNGLLINGTSNNATLNRVAFNNNRSGIRTGTTTRANNFRMLNSTITGGQIGVQTYNNYEMVGGVPVATGSFANALFENVTIDGPTFKGFYFETANNLTLKDVTVINAGNYGAPITSGDQHMKYGSAIDINLKYDAFDAVTLQNVLVKNSGHSSNHDTRAAVVIKTRGIPGDSSAYTAAPASLQSVNIIGGSIEGSTGTALRMETLSNGSGGQPTAVISGGTQFRNNTTDIAVDKTNVDARGAVFVDAADGFAIEDRVTHALDASGRGLVTWEAGKVYVTQNSGSIQRGVDAAGIGDTVNVANANFSENVMVNSRRGLAFNDTRLQSLALGSGAAGSGIGGKVTAEGSGGFLFDAPVNLLADTTLATTGADIRFNGDIQNAGSVARGLRLTAGTGATRGNVHMTTGGSAGAPLGYFDVSANSFSLDSTLWVGNYKIDALGNVTLSNSTLRAQDSSAASSLNAGGDVTGSTISQGSVGVVSAGNIQANITGTAVAAQAQGTMDVVVTASQTATLTADTIVATITAANVVATSQGNMNVVVAASGSASLGGGTVVADVTAPVVAVAAANDAQVSGSAGQITLDAPKGSVSGSFGQVSNTGSGLVNVNGKPQANQTVSRNAENNRVVPVSGVQESGAEGGVVQPVQTGDFARQGGSDISMSPPEAAGEALDSGRSIELDMSPRKQGTQNNKTDKQEKEQGE